VSAAAYFAQSDTDAVFAAGGTVWVKRGGEISPLGVVENAVAVQAAGEFVFAADSGSVYRIEPATGLRSEFACGCTVTTLDPMAGRAVFRLNSGTGEPLYLFDGNGPAPGVLFVPPAPAKGGPRLSRPGRGPQTTPWKGHAR
jgi:hypothetical protein